MFKPNRIVVFIVLAVALAACGGTAATKAPASAGSASSKPAASAPAASAPTQANASTAAPGTQPTLPSKSNGETNGEAGGTEAALVTYADVAQGFSIGYPGPWTQDRSVTKGVKFVGGDDALTLEFVTPAAGTDVTAYAKQDVAAVQAAFPGFQQLNLNASTEVNNAIVLGFTANGTSAVTGKPFTAHDERYYIDLADGRIAVLTVTGPDSHYDREGVRDIALTLKVTK